MDADGLIKLTKASAKEAVALEFTVILPPDVRLECIDQGKAGGYADAIKIEENVRKGLLRVKKTGRDANTESIIRGLGLMGGEADALRLFRSGAADMIVGDDRRFLNILEGLGIPFATPSALLIALVQSRRLGKDKAIEHLERLAEYISAEEYSEARHVLEAA